MAKRYVVFPDVEITRRKRTHMIFDDQGNFVRAERLFQNVIRWLHQEGHHRWLIYADGEAFEINHTPAPVEIEAD